MALAVTIADSERQNMREEGREILHDGLMQITSINSRIGAQALPASALDGGQKSDELLVIGCPSIIGFRVSPSR